jgi:hypothetical protein
MLLLVLVFFTASDARGTSRLGASSAGPRPNAVRPYIKRKLFAKKTRIYGIAMQG